MRALLDVNVLIALLDGSHIHHGLVTDWLASHIDEGWASSPITQNGCIRILSRRVIPIQFPPHKWRTDLQKRPGTRLTHSGPIPSACCNPDT